MVVSFDGCYSRKTVYPRIPNCLGIHHSNEGWNSEILLILRVLLDFIFRWNSGRLFRENDNIIKLTTVFNLIFILCYPCCTAKMLI